MKTKDEIHFKTSCHPEANGRKPRLGDVSWTVHMPLESGEVLYVHMGKKGRDTLFGMMIADCHDSGEGEPNRATPEEIAREKVAEFDRLGDAALSIADRQWLLRNIANLVIEERKGTL